jgi:hypothetical protein
MELGQLALCQSFNPQGLHAHWWAPVHTCRHSHKAPLTLTGTHSKPQTHRKRTFTLKDPETQFTLTGSHITTLTLSHTRSALQPVSPP